MFVTEECPPFSNRGAAHDKRQVPTKTKAAKLRLNWCVEKPYSTTGFCGLGRVDEEILLNAVETTSVLII